MDWSLSKLIESLQWVNAIDLKQEYGSYQHIFVSAKSKIILSPTPENKCVMCKWKVQNLPNIYCLIAFKKCIWTWFFYRFAVGSGGSWRSFSDGLHCAVDVHTSLPSMIWEYKMNLWCLISCMLLSHPAFLGRKDIVTLCTVRGRLSSHCVLSVREVTKCANYILFFIQEAKINEAGEHSFIK